MRPTGLATAAVVVVVATLALTGCVAEEEPVSVEVDLTGTLLGDDWVADPSAILTTWPEVPETWLEVTIRYAGDRSDNRTPGLSANFDTELGNIECETSRSYLWNSTESGAPMELSMRCGMVPDSSLDEVGTVALSER